MQEQITVQCTEFDNARHDYLEYLDRGEDSAAELRIWWSSSCMSEMKRLKEKEIEIRQKFNF